MLLRGVKPVLLMDVQLLPDGSYTSAVGSNDVQSVLLQPPITYTFPATEIARAFVRAFPMLATATGAALVIGSYISIALSTCVGVPLLIPPTMYSLPSASAAAVP